MLPKFHAKIPRNFVPGLGRRFRPSVAVAVSQRATLAASRPAAPPAPAAAAARPVRRLGDSLCADWKMAIL